MGRRDAPFGGLSFIPSAAPELRHGRMKQVIPGGNRLNPTQQHNSNINSHIDLLNPETRHVNVGSPLQTPTVLVALTDVANSPWTLHDPLKSVVSTILVT